MRDAPYILVLEDDRDIADVLKEALRTEGYRCFSLRSKAKAERFLRRVRPDLIIVDYALIGGSGMQAAQMAAAADVPVIVTSGHPTARAEAVGLGFTFLEKPFRIAELLPLAAKLVSRDPPRLDLGRR